MNAAADQESKVSTAQPVRDGPNKIPPPCTWSISPLKAGISDFLEVSLVIMVNAAEGVRLVKSAPRISAINLISSAIPGKNNNAASIGTAMKCNDIKWLGRIPRWIAFPAIKLPNTFNMQNPAMT